MGMYAIKSEGLSRLKSRFSRMYWDVLDSVFAKYPVRPSKSLSNSQYAIGVVTYVARYEEHFVPLITRLRWAFPDTQIVVAANGYHDLGRQREYLDSLDALLAPFSNVSVIKALEPQPLSRLWNLILIRTEPNKVLIMNDDIKIGLNFRREFERSRLDGFEVATINSSWSHFVMSKSVVCAVGWFDERMSGVGYEDYDYEGRLALAKVPLKNISTRAVRNLVFQTRDFSYGRDMPIVHKKYSKANELFYLTKWEFWPGAREGYVWVRIMNCFARIKPGMENPDYYPEVRSEYRRLFADRIDRK